MIADQKNLLVLAFDATAESYIQKLKIDTHQLEENNILRQTKKELIEYFQKTRKEFSISLDPKGTLFQRKVWTHLQSVPYGVTKSYFEQAHELKMKSAVRAVASANGRNPISIIIPCHRILRMDGSLGGYSGGLDVKAKLLQLEEP